jgi:hypothetical protein
VLHLLPEERVRHLKTPSISTLTFYDGAFPAEDLRRRLKVIVEQNRWLQSRLVRVTRADKAAADPSLGLTEGVTAVYPIKQSGGVFVDFFQKVSDSQLSADMPYEPLVQRVKPYDVPLGRDSIGEDRPLFMVTLFEIEPDKRYCVMVSLCHTLGDGFTFYKIHAMLNPSTPVTALNVQRVTQFSKEVKDNLNFGSSLRELPFAIWGSLCNKYAQPRMEARICFVNPKAVEAEKRAFQAAQPPAKETFISTNDVLTAWFYRFSGVDLGFMIANFRGRKPYLTNDHGGNYQGRILHCSREMYLPATIRESLPIFKCPTGSTPSLSQIAALNLALVTNWASFYCAVEYAGCSQTMHLPVIDVSGVVLRQCLVIFQARRGQLGVILWTRGIPQERFEAEAILEKVQ